MRFHSPHCRRPIDVSKDKSLSRIRSRSRGGSFSLRREMDTHLPDWDGTKSIVKAAGFLLAATLAVGMGMFMTYNAVKDILPHAHHWQESTEDWATQKNPLLRHLDELSNAEKPSSHGPGAQEDLPIWVHRDLPAGSRGYSHIVERKTSDGQTQRAIIIHVPQDQHLQPGTSLPPTPFRSFGGTYPAANIPEP